MSSHVCLVHYHEIGLKGKNRSTFERQLITNLKRALKGRSAHVERLSGYVRVHFDDGQVPEDVPGIIARVPGVARVSVAWRCERVPEQYNEALWRLHFVQGSRSSLQHRLSHPQYRAQPPGGRGAVRGLP